MSMFWCNGAFKNESDRIFGPRERIRYGDGIFDTLLCVNGKPVHWGRHYERMTHDATVLGLSLEGFPKNFREHIEMILEKNEFLEGRFALNTLITRGESERGLRLPEVAESQIIMRASALPDSFPAIHAVIAETVRRNEGSPLSRIKSCNYGDHILARIEADKRGANEAVLLNNAGYVTCATIGNIFIEKKGVLYTPPVSDGVLPGIIRGLIIEEFGAIEAQLTPSDVLNAEGVYVTNSIRGAVPVQILNRNTMPKPSVRIPGDFHCL